MNRPRFSREAVVGVLVTVANMLLTGTGATMSLLQQRIWWAIGLYVLTGVLLGQTLWFIPAVRQRVARLWFNHLDRLKQLNWLKELNGFQVVIWLGWAALGLGAAGGMVCVRYELTKTAVVLFTFTALLAVALFLWYHWGYDQDIRDKKNLR